MRLVDLAHLNNDHISLLRHIYLARLGLLWNRCFECSLKQSLEEISISLVEIVTVDLQLLGHSGWCEDPYRLYELEPHDPFEP